MWGSRLAAGMAALTAASVSLAESSAFMLNPDIHGDKVVFTREGDVWLGNLNSGDAKRLTRFEGLESKARFSPDGSKIAFQAQYDGGGTQVYVMPTAGGIPERVTNALSAANLEDWTPDGKKLLCVKPGAQFVYVPFLIDADGGPEEALPMEKLGMGQIGPDGRLAFCRFRDISGGAWFRYKGGSRNDIWIGDLKNLSFKKVFDSKTQAQYPQWIGDRIFFVHENEATWSINSVPANGGAVKKHTTNSNEVVYDLQSDGKRLVYVRGNGLEVYDPATNKTTAVNLDLTSDRIHMRPQRIDPAPLTWSTITPTGKRLLIEARGQILSVPVREGEVRVWKAQPGVRLQKPAMSPDGKKVAYVSDETREQQVYVADADGSNPRQVTRDSGRQIMSVLWSPTSDRLAIGDSESRIRLVKADGTEDRQVGQSIRNLGPMYHRFSPDGKWLAYVQEKPWTNQNVQIIYMHDIAAQKSYPVTTGRYRDDFPEFSTDGRFLVYTSYRALAFTADNLFSQLNSATNAAIVVVPLSRTTTSPFRPRNDEEGAAAGEKPADDKTVRVDLEGIETRFFTIPGVTGEIGQVALIGDRVVYAVGNQINYYDMSARSGGTITTGGSFDVSADGKSLLIGTLRVVPVAGKDLPATAGVTSLQGFKLEIDPAKEWEQIFWDAWRLCRDFFYVRNMHGVDWPAVGKKYAALLPQVRARNELAELIRWMQAELSTGHSFRAEPQIFVSPATSTPAYLGIETVADQGWHKITRIYDGDGMATPAPILEPGNNVGVGTYILAVNNKPTPSDVDWREYLRDRAGQVVSLTVNSSPSTAGARTIYVRAHTAAAERVLLERDQVKKRREYVDQKSGGKVGYVYLAGMVEGDMDEFAIQYFSQLDKEAMIIDIRENGGGFISAIVVNLLKKQPYLIRSQRNSLEPNSRYHDSFPGHLSMLINEGSYSDGEGGPTNWAYAKLGPLIGSRTYGALVGSAPAWPLVDGSGIQVPRYGNYREDVGWVVEGTGVVPDIEVENDPNLWAKGIDAQLERAVKEMMDRAAKNPVHRPIQPPDPVTGGKRGGG